MNAEYLTIIIPVFSMVVVFLVIYFLYAAKVYKLKQEMADKSFNAYQALGMALSIELKKIKGYSELKHCGMDTEKLTVTLKFDNLENLQSFVLNHNSTFNVLNFDQDKRKKK